ncbi:MAG: site-2 protease family protein [bacterium]
MNIIVSYLLFLPPILFALTIHEYSHGYAALHMGDPTAKFAGRLTLNPIKHIDILGLLAFIIFRFGWAKPVPINSSNFTNLKKGIIYTSLAGPLSNFLIAIPFGLITRVVPTDVNYLLPIRIMLEGFVLFNLIFCVFNLIPIPPLDGSHVLFAFLPPKYRYIELWLMRYGFFVLIGLIMFDRVTGIPVLWGWIGPFTAFFSRLFAGNMIIL